MASYGNSLVATNVSLQRPLKMNWNTSLGTGTGTGSTAAPFTISLLEDKVIVNGVETKGVGLQTHAAFEIAFNAPAVADATPALVITFPGTADSSAYKPQIDVVKTTAAQIDGTNGEDDYVVREAANLYRITRVSRGAGTGVASTVRVFVRLSVNTDSLA